MQSCPNVYKLVFTVFRFFTVVPLLLLVVFTPARALAATNQTINFQGKLVDSTGLNVPDGTQYQLTFKLYNVASGGTPIWTEVQSNVTVTSGIFQVQLGSVTPLSGIDFNNSNLYLGITVSGNATGGATGESEMTPRIQFTAVPYAFNAASLQGVVATQSATGFTLTGGYQNPKTLNLTDNITLGLTITPTSTNSLTVKSNGASGLMLDTGGAAALGIGASANAITIGNNTFANNTAVTITTGGSGIVTIGSNTGTGNVVVSPNAGGQAALVVNNQGSGDLFTASASGATKFVITNGGNVGIGTNSPTAPLTLVGNALITNALTAGVAATATKIVTGDPNTKGLIIEASSSSGNNFPTTSLAGYYKFDENSGSTVGDSVNSNNGTWQGTLGSQWTTGKINSGGNFNGTNNYVSVANNSVQNAYPFSVSAWVKTTLNNGSQTGIVTKYVSGSSNGYNLYVKNGHVYGWYLASSSNYVYNLSAGDGVDGGLVNDGNWHLVVFTVDANGGEIYVDGSLKNTMAWVGTPTASTTTQPLAIGYYVSSAAYFSGNIDEVGIWGKALSASDVTTLYNSGNGLEYGPQSQLANLQEWQNSSASVLAAVDASGNILPGTTLTENLGSSSFVWNNLFASTILTNGNTGLNLYASGSGNITLGQNLGTGNVVVAPNAGGQAALMVNDWGSGDLFTASASGNTKFVINSSGNVGINTINPLASLDTRGLTYTTPVASISGATGKATLVLDQSGVGDLFTASYSGNPRFVINNLGRVTISGSENINSVTANQLNAMVHIVGASGINGVESLIFDQYGANSNAPGFIGRFARGTDALPSAISSGDKLLVIGGRGYGSSGFAGLSNAAIEFVAAQGFSDINQGTYMDFQTTPLNSTGRVERLRIDSTGQIGINTINPLAVLDVRGNGVLGTNIMNGTIPVASISGKTSFAGLVVDNSGAGDLFTASQSGGTRFTISANGNITDSNYAVAGGIMYGSSTGLLQITGAGNSSQCLVGGATPTWGSCGTGGSSPFKELIANGLIVPLNGTEDFLVGGTSTASADFGLINVAGGTPTATISAGVSGSGRGLYITGSGTIATTANQNLVLGANTGISNVLVSPNAGGQAALMINDQGVGDLFTASAGATTRFTISNAGLLTDTASFTTGTLASISATTNTVTGNIIGQNLDLSLINPVDKSFTGFQLNMPTGYSDTQATTNYGLKITSAGTYGTNSGGSTSSYAGVDVTLPNLRTTGGDTMTMYGLKVTNGTITQAGGATATDYGLYLNYYGISSGSLYGIYGNLTSPGAGTQNFITVNGGWTNGIVFTGSAQSVADITSTGLRNLVLADNTTTGTVLIQPNAAGQAALTIKDQGVGDLFTASAGASTKFVIANTGNLSLATGANIDTFTSSGTINLAGGANTSTLNLGKSGGTINLPNFATNNNSVLTTGASGLLTAITTTTSGQCLISNAAGSTPSWGGCSGTASTPSPFKEVTSNGTIVPLNNTEDFLIGGAATTSADFAFMNVSSLTNTPTASISGGSNNAIYLTGSGTLATTNRQNLVLGSSTTTGAVVIQSGTGGFGGLGITIQAGHGSLTSGNGGGLTLMSGSGGSLSGNSGDVTIDTGGASGGIGGNINIGTSKAQTLNFGNSSTTIILGGGGNTVTFTSSSGLVYAGTARLNKTITLSPEYAGAVLTASGSATTTGSMTSDASSSASLAANGTVWKTFYSWTSTTASPLQDYTVAVRVTLPQDFSAWQSTAMTIDYDTLSTSASNNALDVYIYNPSATNPTAPVYFSTNNVSANWDGWTTLSIGSAPFGDGVNPDWNTAGQSAVIYLKMHAMNGSHVLIGDIKLNYLSKF